MLLVTFKCCLRLAETPSRPGSETFSCHKNPRDRFSVVKDTRRPQVSALLREGSVTFLCVRVLFRGHHLCGGFWRLLAGIAACAHCSFPEVNCDWCRWWVRCTMCVCAPRETGCSLDCGIFFWRVPRQMFTELADVCNIYIRKRMWGKNVSPDCFCMVCAPVWKQAVGIPVNAQKVHSPCSSGLCGCDWLCGLATSANNTPTVITFWFECHD